MPSISWSRVCWRWIMMVYFDIYDNDIAKKEQFISLLIFCPLYSPSASFLGTLHFFCSLHEFSFISQHFLSRLINLQSPTQPSAKAIPKQPKRRRANLPTELLPAAPGAERVLPLQWLAIATIHFLPSADCWWYWSSCFIWGWCYLFLYSRAMPEQPWYVWESMCLGITGNGDAEDGDIGSACVVLVLDIGAFGKVASTATPTIMWPLWRCCH